MEHIIQIEHVKHRFDKNVIHEDINLTVKRGEIIGIIGSSGCGKTTLLRSILMLHKPEAGIISVFGQNIQQCSQAEINQIRRRMGVLFQHSALFSSLTVLENITF